MKDKKERILLVDDEEPAIQGIKRLLMLHGYQPMSTTKPKLAVEILATNEIGVLVCDQRMPDMSGNEVLQFAKTHDPNIVCILLTGYSDLSTTIEAINNGLIYRYLSKPVNETDLIQAIDDAFAHRREKMDSEVTLHNLSIAHDAMKKTLNELQGVIGQQKKGAINSLLKAVKVKDPELYEHSKRVELYVRKISEKFGYALDDIENLALAGLFHDLGKLALRDHILYKDGPLDSEDFDKMKEHVVWGAEIIRELGIIDKAADIVLEHHEKLDGSGYPFGKKDNEISHAAKILTIADIYDALVTERVYHKAMTKEAAFEALKKDADTKLDGGILMIFEELLE
jgi:putative nucleotidyltransferase with HDIG domain